MGTCNIDDVLTMDCLVNTDEAAFIATGVTDGEMLRGVKYFGIGRAHQLGRHGRQVEDGSLHRDTIYRTGAEKFWVRMD